MLSILVVPVDLVLPREVDVINCDGSSGCLCLEQKVLLMLVVPVSSVV